MKGRYRMISSLADLLNLPFIQKWENDFQHPFTVVHKQAIIRFASL